MGIRRTEIHRRRKRREKRKRLIEKLGKAPERDQGPILERLEKTFPLVASRRKVMEDALAQHGERKLPGRRPG